MQVSPAAIIPYSGGTPIKHRHAEDVSDDTPDTTALSVDDDGLPTLLPTVYRRSLLVDIRV